MKTKKIIQTIILLVVMAAVPACNSQEKELEKQIQLLNAEKAQFKSIETTVDQLAQVTARLSDTVILIANLKRRGGAGEMLKKAVNVIPKSLLLKELRFSSGTLTFTLLSPNRDTVSTFLSNLEETRVFQNVESVSNGEAQSGGTAKYAGYTVTCDYKKYLSDKDEEKSLGPMQRKHARQPNTDDPAADGNEVHGADIQTLKKTIKILEDQIRTLKRRAPGEHLLRETLKAKQATLVKLKEILPEGPDNEPVIKKIQSMASQSKIKMTACTAEKVKPKGIYAEVPITIEASGRFEQVIQFMRLWDKQKKLFWTPSIHLVFPTGKVHRDQIQVSLTLSTALQNFE